jgi:Protein of unknown function (DUF669)
MSLLNFDASRVAPSTGEQDPVPAGWYDVVMDQSEMKPTKDSATTGNAFLECRFNIASGTYTGRKLFSRLNLRNNNPVAAEIAYKELSAICHAVNLLQVQDSQQLHGLPMKAKVKVRPGDGQYGPQNEISTFKPANFVPEQAGAAVAPGAVPPMQQPPAMPAQPWAAPGQAPAPAQWAAPAQPPMQPPQQPWQQQPPPMQPQQPAMAPQQPQQAPPWQQPGAQAPQQPAQPPAQAPQQPAQPWAGGVDPQSAVPPWQRPPGQ